VRDPWTPPLPIRTARLVLRAHLWSDLDDLVRFHGDATTTQYLPWPVRDRRATEDALRVKLRQDRAPAEGDWLVLAIEEAASGEVIGEVDLRRAPALRGDIGYVVRRDREGRGLASEAVTAILRYAFDVVGLHAVDAFISPGNDASARLALRHGFERNPARDTPGPDNPTSAYTLTLERYRTWDARAGA
jgi:RimJ/RimL family protein N-acetyltransferase